VHGFILVNPEERGIIDSAPVQRLRHVHQLSLSYLVYPGATHRRFEHSLGVMELAGQVFDTLTDPQNVTDSVRDLLPEVDRADQRHWWRMTVRMAALLHDVGHLPFSHGAEHALLPAGYNHERLTRELVASDHLAPLLSTGVDPPLRPEVIAKLAVGRKECPGETFTPWERILSDIVVDDAFGVDRMDYLQRDSIHAGSLAAASTTCGCWERCGYCPTPPRRRTSPNQPLGSRSGGGNQPRRCSSPGT